MRTKKEIIERIEELIKKRNWLLKDFAPDHEINEVEAEIYALLWVIKDDFKGGIEYDKSILFG